MSSYVWRINVVPEWLPEIDYWCAHNVSIISDLITVDGIIRIVAVIFILDESKISSLPDVLHRTVPIAYDKK